MGVLIRWRSFRSRSRFLRRRFFRIFVFRRCRALSAYLHLSRSLVQSTIVFLFRLPSRSSRESFIVGGRLRSQWDQFWIESFSLLLFHWFLAAFEDGLQLR